MSEAALSQKGEEAPNAWRVEPEQKKSEHNVGQMEHNLHKVKRVLQRIKFNQQFSEQE